MNEYISQENIDSLNNYQLLIFTTEHYTQFMYFLKEYRNYKNFKIKIGNFKYDDWSANLFCVLDEKESVYFKHIRDFDNKEWKNKSLTEQLIYAWGFKEINFNITFDIINNLWNLLDNKEKEIYDKLYDEAHSKFW